MLHWTNWARPTPSTDRQPRSTVVRCALFLGPRRAQIPRIGAKSGSKRPLITDGNGTPLAIEHTGANVHDSEWPYLWSMPSSRSSALRAARANVPKQCTQIGRTTRKKRSVSRFVVVASSPMIAKRNTEHGSGLGTIRWVVEAAFSWLFQQRRLRGVPGMACALEV